MTRGWQVVVCVGVVTMLTKGVGPLWLGRRSLPPLLRRAVVRLAPALFAGLIATQVFARDHGIMLDARAGGLAVAIIAAAAGAPPIAILAAAVATTATVRRAVR
ncbi:MAG TPA: AzlD domain-containing protein [Gemmatimonadaceae bacterium]